MSFLFALGSRFRGNDEGGLGSRFRGNDEEERNGHALLVGAGV